MVKQLVTDYTRAKISYQNRAMLDYVAKLTLEPWSMEEKDVQQLRVAGFTDREILDVNQIAGYYAYVNRLADGLGVRLEDFWNDEISEQ